MKTPAVVGANSTCNGQSVLAARLVVPQPLPERTNGAVTEMLLMGMGTRLPLATVIVSGEETVPSSIWPIASLGGVRVTVTRQGSGAVDIDGELAAVDVGVNGHLARERAGGLRRKRDLDSATGTRGDGLMHAVVGFAEVAGDGNGSGRRERGCRC